ncbi:hypothetical protein [Sulfuriferula plumbiphila]|uniref:hypothetical protein n=1 Tax=Sulfuriferula plumbiphila TaxID=171865 RepID=UPI0018E0C2C5|nr:hypothetical protein [Sulfuriferula plumbiphila]
MGARRAVQDLVQLENAGEFVHPSFPVFGFMSDSASNGHSRLKIYVVNAVKS